MPTTKVSHTDTVTHTPGPWRVDDSFQIPTVVAHCFPRGAKCVAVVYGDGSQTQILARVPDEERQSTLANAHLLAAAPDLYEAMKGAMQYLDETLGPCEDDCECLLHSFHAALAKAEARS